MNRVLAVSLMLLLGPAVLRAQDDGLENCDLASSRQLYYVSGGAIVYVGGPVFSCRNGSTVTADSAVYVRDTDRVDFIGNVRFDDAERTLTSQYAQYLPGERRIMAQVNVVLTSKQDGSTLRGAAMDYFQRSDQYPEGRIDVHSGLPQATLFRENRERGGVDTTVVDADRMQIVGEQLFRGWGNVQMRRGDVRSSSDYAEFDEASERMRLVGNATVESDTFRLRADSIEAVVLGGSDFRELHAYRNVVMESESVDLTAPIVRMNFSDGELEQLVALGGARVGEDAPQARAVSPEFVLVADSIDALAPKQQLERVFAIGKARADRWGDTIQDRDLPELIRNDWVEGDTIRAWFTEAPDTASDTTRVLERIVALGSPARSAYRLREQSGDSVEISVNYLTAQSLDVRFREGEVERVVAEGQIRGMYLQPEARARESSPSRPAAGAPPPRSEP